MSQVIDVNVDESQRKVSSEEQSSSTNEEKDVDIDSHAMIKLLLSKQDTWNSRRYGNHKVCCGGKIVIGPVKKMWWLLELLCVITGISFACEYEKFHLGVTVFGSMLFLSVVMSSWRTLLCDPGIVKRPEFKIALENAREAIRMNTNGFPTKRMERNNRIEAHKYCSRCHCFREPRTRHCYICDSCVEKFDHHCPVFGGCIGRRNLRWFQLMVFSIIAYLLYILINGIIITSISNLKGSRTTAKSVFSSCITLNIFVGGCIVLALLAPFVTCLEPKDPHEESIRPYGILPPSKFAKIKIYPLEQESQKHLMVTNGTSYISDFGDSILI